MISITLSFASCSIFRVFPTIRFTLRITVDGGDAEGKFITLVGTRLRISEGAVGTDGCTAVVSLELEVSVCEGVWLRDVTSKGDGDVDELLEIPRLGRVVADGLMLCIGLSLDNIDGTDDDVSPPMMVGLPVSCAISLPVALGGGDIELPVVVGVFDTSGVIDSLPT